MLTARNVITGVIIVAVLSLVSAGASMMFNTPGSEGLGSDFHGTRANGFQAIYDVLAELGVEADRQLIPSPPDDTTETTFVLWRPLESLVQTEPAHLRRLADWVRSGGRLVVAPSGNMDYQILLTRAQLGSQQPLVSLLAELGLPDIYVGAPDSSESTLFEMSNEELEAEARRAQQARFEGGENRIDDYDEFRDAVLDMVAPEDIPSKLVPVSADGDFEFLNAQIHQIRLPEAETRVIDYGNVQPVGRVTFQIDENEHTLAAEFRVGTGTVTVVSDPALARNDFFVPRDGSRADNSIVAAHLLTGNRSRVVFDEFYHGLTIRGNAMWLLTQRPYLTTTIAILVIVGLWIWRQAIFPGPGRDVPGESRRTISEYIEAMARLINKARHSRQFVLHEVREGTLWSLRRQLGLQPGSEESETVLAALSRRYPATAAELRTALAQLDERRRTPDVGENEAIESIRKVTDCLSK